MLFGGFFLMSGYKHIKNIKMMAGYASSKGVPMPMVATFVTGVLLLLGGAGVVLGIFVKFSLACLAIFLVGVTLKMHDYWNLEDPTQKMSQQVNFNKNVALLGAVLMFLAIPLPWAVALF